MTAATDKSAATAGDVAHDQPANRQHDRWRVDRAVLLSYGIGAIFLLLAATVWYASDVLLLLFTGVLLAVLLDDAITALRKLLPMPRAVALLVTVLAVLALASLGAWFLAPRVSSQASQLWTALPAALQEARAVLERNEVLRNVVSALPAPEQMFPNAPEIVGGARKAFSNLMGGIGSTAIVLVVALYLAARPRIYRDGILKLVPPARRGRYDAVLAQLGSTLRHWLRGKLFSMVVVGTVTAGGLVLLGVPLGLTLGILAGLLDFIPYIGPLLAAVPAVLLAFTNDPLSALYVVLLFAGIQTLEGYLLLPLVERNTVALPPALTVSMQVLMGVAFGLLGVALATPLTAVATVLVAMLYVKDVLGDEVGLPGG